MAADQGAAPPPPPGAAEAFRRLPLLRGLPPAAADGLAARFAPRMRWAEFAPGQNVVEFEDATTDVFFIAAGQVRIAVRTQGGQELILEDLPAGGFFGDMAAIDGAARSAAVTALNRSRIGRLPGAEFLRMVSETPELARRLMRILVQRLRLMNERMLDLTSLDIRHRLYAELLRLAVPGAGSTRVISPPPVQHILASRIGARREPVSREIAQLRRSGLIQQARGALVLSRPDVLEERVAAARQK
jgi:CRP-like cAMP-binding protein